MQRVSIPGEAERSITDLGCFTICEPIRMNSLNFAIFYATSRDTEKYTTSSPESRFPRRKLG